jgi:hypothetical protein
MLSGAMLSEDMSSEAMALDSIALDGAIEVSDEPLEVLHAARAIGTARSAATRPARRTVVGRDMTSPVASVQVVRSRCAFGLVSDVGCDVS